MMSTFVSADDQADAATDAPTSLFRRDDRWIQLLLGFHDDATDASDGSPRGACGSMALLMFA